MPPKRGAWGDDGGDHTTVDQVEEFDPAKPSSPSAPPPPSSSQQPSTATSGEIVEGEPVDDGKPGCCARGCVGCGRVFRLIGKAILYFFLYLFGFVFLLVLGTLHAVFRILHMIFNICSQCRRADVDVMREFHYASGSDASGSEGDREADDLAAIDAFERNEQLLIIMGRGGSANNGAGSSQRPQVMSRPPRTRDDIKAARAARKAKKADDAKRIVALLSGLPDPGVQHGSKSEIYPPKFASVKCCLSSCVATFGMVLVSITFLFYSLSYSTLLGIVALASVMFPSTTVGGMKVIKEYQDHSDIMVRPPRTSEPPPAGAQAV